MTAEQLIELRNTAVPASGNRLAAAFRIAKRSQMSCARDTKLRPQFISDVKAGRVKRPTIATGHVFATWFGCAIEDLFPAAQGQLFAPAAPEEVDAREVASVA